MPKSNTCSFEGCGRPCYGLDPLCNAHYQQRRKGKDLKPLRVNRARNVAFQESVQENNSGCWEWTGCLNGGGYGRFWTGSRHQVAHRYSWERTHGAIPPGRDIDHLCHNHLCVNPEHLRLATRQQNAQHRFGPCVNNKSGYRGVDWHDGDKKWRARVTHGGKIHFVGNFETAEEAGEAARLKRLELFTHSDRDRMP